MRKLLMLFLALATAANTANAAFTKKIKLHAYAVSPAEQKAAAYFFMTLDRKDYEQLTGTRLGLIQRLAFKLSQKSLKRQMQKREQQTEDFNAIGFIVGFVLNIWGVLGAYIFSRDSNLHKWAWIGLGSVFLLSLIFVFLFLIALGSNFK